MKVKLMHHTPLHIADYAISKCWDKGCDKDKVNYEKIDRIANKFKHASTIEHVTYNFEIIGISRALLQELARHRMANLSVKSTRYTLKELKAEGQFYCYGDNAVNFASDEYERAGRYLVWTISRDVNIASIMALENLRTILNNGTSNDVAKYCLPESYKTELVWTVNARSLQNFLRLRSDRSALWEIRDLAKTVFGTIPKEHQFLYEECMFKEKQKEKKGD